MASVSFAAPGVLTEVRQPVPTALHQQRAGHLQVSDRGWQSTGARHDRDIWAPLVTGCLVGARVAQRRRSQKPPGAGAATVSESVNPEDQWIVDLDLQGFGREMAELGHRLRAEQGQADLDHLQRVVFWSDVCAFVGLATMWLSPNLLTVMALGLWTHSRWTMVAHHSIHGGYNRLSRKGHDRYSSRKFGVGSLTRRVGDWFDWMLPEAWSVYHNQGHHYRVNESADPDFFEKYTRTWVLNKDFMTVLSMLFFKWAFAAPNTYKAMKLQELKKAGKQLPEGFDPQMTMTIFQVFRMERLGQGIFSVWEFFVRVIGPYFLIHFFLRPLPLMLINPAFYWNGVANLFLGELVANIHGFIVTTFNHTGDDVYCFQRGCRPNSPTFYLRAVIGSANCCTGGELNDFMHGYLNYQIEHHLWPDLSMLAYRRGQPQAKAICEKYGVPYVQDNVFARLGKVLGIFTGRAQMRQFPDHLEREADMMDWKDGKESFNAQRQRARPSSSTEQGSRLVTS
eukprot:gb/GFBE01047173.1/.p1 GENE.gb/GFBE01047173.1/~~gb/GFBE01047173.1/.p1  ORF type:complete len:509 (+),score=88.99 gb/GFBE01047173.1/:1-1527(+)